MVKVQFEKFNSNFRQLEVAFYEVTKREFKPGQKLSIVEKKNRQVRTTKNSYQVVGSFMIEHHILIWEKQFVSSCGHMAINVKSTK